MKTEQEIQKKIIELENKSGIMKVRKKKLTRTFIRNSYAYAQYCILKWVLNKHEKEKS